MKAHAQKITGSIFLLIGIGWLVWSEIVWGIAPIGIASEAPYRHIENMEKIAKEDLFHMSWEMAREFREANPHPLAASIPLILGLLLLCIPKSHNEN